MKNNEKVFVSVMALIVIGLSLGCTSSFKKSEVRHTDSAESVETQFFSGEIQRSSLDGKIPYGPKFASLVKRSVNREHGTVRECVFQEGKSFLSVMVRTQDNLRYSLQDAAGFSQGDLIFADASLQAWSYEIEVLKPVTGKITGALADGKGARITAGGKMEIRKVWNDQMLIHEVYGSITQDEYRLQLQKISLLPSLPDECRN